VSLTFSEVYVKVNKSWYVLPESTRSFDRVSHALVNIISNNNFKHLPGHSIARYRKASIRSCRVLYYQTCQTEKVGIKSSSSVPFCDKSSD